jgi:hypothetical protein
MGYFVSWESPDFLLPLAFSFLVVSASHDRLGKTFSPSLPVSKISYGEYFPTFA